MAGEQGIDAAILGEGHHVGRDEEVVEPAQGIDAEQEPERSRTGGGPQAIPRQDRVFGRGRVGRPRAGRHGADQKGQQR